MRRSTLAGLMAGTVLTVTLSSGWVLAKAEYTKKEGAACTTCHTKSGDKALNPVGTCYATKKDLAACKK